MRSDTLYDIKRSPQLLVQIMTHRNRTQEKQTNSEVLNCKMATKAWVLPGGREWNIFLLTIFRKIQASGVHKLTANYRVAS